jgi:hypothetical protein
VKVLLLLLWQHAAPVHQRVQCLSAEGWGRAKNPEGSEVIELLLLLSGTQYALQLAWLYIVNYILSARALLIEHECT